MGDNGRQDHFRAQEADHTNQHPPHMKGDNRRQRETRPLQSPRSRPHQPTPTPHEGRQPETMGDNGRQDHFRAQEADHTNQHPPHMKGDNRRQWETTGDKTTSEPKKPTTPTNTKAARSKVAVRTPTVNCLGKKMTNSSFERVRRVLRLQPQATSGALAPLAPLAGPLPPP